MQNRINVTIINCNGVNTFTLSAQHNKNTNASHFDIFLYIIIISKLHVSCVYAM